MFEGGSTNNIFQKNILCAKIYKSHDFYSLYNSFPTDKNGFDIKLGTVEHWGSFSYKIKKQDDTQKGILFGFFIEAEDSILPIYSSDIRLRAYKAEKNIDEKKIKIIMEEVMAGIGVGITPKKMRTGHLILQNLFQ